MRHLDEGTLQAWLDRDRSGLDAETRAEIEGHLATCEECIARLDELEEVDRRATAVLSSAEPVDGPIPDFEAVIERSRSSSRRPRRSPWLTTAWAASLVGAIAAGWMTNELTRGGTPPGAPTVGAESVQRPAAARGERGELRPEDPDEAGESSVPPPAVADQAAVGEPEAEAPLEAASPGPEAGEPATARRIAETPGGDRSAESAEATGAPAPEEALTAAMDETGDPLVLTGRVTDQRGRPVSSAQVFVPGAGAGTLTDQDGGFTLTLPRRLESGDDGLEVAVERIGFARATLPLGPDSLDAGTEAVSADIRLQEEALTLAEVVVPRTADATAGWSPVERARVEEMIGFPIRSIPGLEIVGIDVTEVDGTPVARVRQALGPGATLTLVESGDPVSGTAARFFSLPADSTVTTVATRRGEAWIIGSAPVAADSLRALVDSAR